MPDHPVRPAAEEDGWAVADLLHSTAVYKYEGLAGDRDRALRMLHAAFRRPGNGASREVVRVAELDGAVAGAIAAFPASEVDARARRFMRFLLLRTPPWTWWRLVALHRSRSRITPPPPPDSLYVDALATDRRRRRRGVATALLADAERRARRLGLASLALDAAPHNHAARALYERCGFSVSAERPPRPELPGFVAYVKPL